MILIQLKMISLKGTVDLVVFAGLCLTVLTFHGKGLNTGDPLFSLLYRFAIFNKGNSRFRYKLSSSLNVRYTQIPVLK